MIDAARIAAWREKYKRGDSGYGDDILDLCDEVETLHAALDGLDSLEGTELEFGTP